MFFVIKNLYNNLGDNIGRRASRSLERKQAIRLQVTFTIRDTGDLSIEKKSWPLIVQERKS